MFAVDPRTGGVAVRALPGPVRDRFVTTLRSYLPPGAPIRRLPLHAADDRLLGGLDLAATLQAGCPVATRGLLAEADGGVILVTMAERVSVGTAARLGAAMDTGAVVIERDGFALRSAAAFGLVALDEGVGEDERPPAAMLDRMAFRVDLDGIGLRDATQPVYDIGHIRAARTLLPKVAIPDSVLVAVCSAAVRLGVASFRAPLLTLRAAAAAAALGGRTEVAEADAITAVRLVLAPRATTLPAPDQNQDPPGEAPDDADGDPATQDGETEQDSSGQPLGEIMLDAAKAAMPAGLLARLLAGQAAQPRSRSAVGAGAIRPSMRRGRPIGTRPGGLRNGARLNLIETLRAAAPWQTIRHRARPDLAARRVLVTQDDFRVTRFRHRTETTTIFAVDASGSAALNRLAEAKGAVELVLAECYARRDRVALIAFRGTAAEILLPPTASLVRAKRSLAGLPGGGGTPLAHGIDAAAALADAVRRKGQSPVLVLLSDGRANIGRDGAPGRARAEADALAASRQVRSAGLTCVLVDTSPRPAAEAKRLAAEMGALYLPLPYADSAALSCAIRASTDA